MSASPTEHISREYNVIDERVAHYVSRFMLRQHTGPEAEGQLTSIIQAEVRDLLRRTLDAEGEVGKMKGMLSSAQRTEVAQKEQYDVQLQHVLAETETKLSEEHRTVRGVMRPPPPPLLPSPAQRRLPRRHSPPFPATRPGRAAQGAGARLGVCQGP